MVRLDCSGITFASQLDERHLFEWGMQISGTLRWEQDALVMKSSNLSQASLRDLLALFARYQIPMKQLAQFRNARNESWFAAPKMYWYIQVFG
ncbi:hypothetical protein CSQ90_07085 [Janthinobacterium sp. BJB303]|nr:hypothetical protein CSQ90_07085 [Janthinobacterium sp. BJB303]